MIFAAPRETHSREAHKQEKLASQIKEELIPYPYSDIFHQIIRCTQKTLNESWNRQTDKLKQIKDNAAQQWKEKPQAIIKDTTVINRLRSGRTLL